MKNENKTKKVTLLIILIIIIVIAIGIVLAFTNKKEDKNNDNTTTQNSYKVNELNTVGNTENEIQIEPEDAQDEQPSSIIETPIEGQEDVITSKPTT